VDGAGDVASLVEEVERAAVLREAREHPARLGSLLEREGAAHDAGARPARDGEPRDLLGAGRPERRARHRNVDLFERVLGVLAGLRAGVVALDPHRPALAVDSGQERCREGADDRRHAHGGAPVAVVPLDPVARRQLVLGGAGLGLDAVDEEEPVAAAAGALALQAVDRLDEAAAETGRDVELLGRETHHGLVLAQALRGGRAELLVPEVARDPDDGAALVLLPRSDPAATEQERGREQRRDQPHGTSTRSANDRTSPALLATARYLPAGRASRAEPLESVSADWPPAPTVAPATAMPLPESS